MPSTLVIYYSFEGNTRYAAEIIAAELGADLLELEALDEPGTTGFGKYLWYGKMKLMRRVPRLAPLAVDPTTYKRIVIGCPVWNFTFAPPIETLLQQVSLQGKEIALFCTSGGGARNTIQDMQARLPGNTFVGEGVEFVEPSNAKEASRPKLIAWARSLWPSE